MCAFVYGLNDCDERVRLAAAANIHAELKKNPCCCNCQLSGALMCAMGDCDKRVRKTVEKSLILCGYEIADCAPACCNNGCGNNGCGPAAANCAAPCDPKCGPAAANCGPAPAACCAPAPKACTAPAPAAPAAAPAPAPSAAAPAPAPPAAEPEAYFPSQLRDQQTRKSRNSLSNLFGLRN